MDKQKISVSGNRKITLSTIAQILGIIGVITGIIFGINQWKSNSGRNEPNKEIEEFVIDYFDMLMRQDLSNLDIYFDFPLDRFYDLTQASESDVRNQQLKYYSIWRFQRINLRKETLVVKELERGKKQVRIELDYQTKKNQKDKFLNYRLEIIMMLNSKNQIKSIYEMKI